MSQAPDNTEDNHELRKLIREELRRELHRRGTDPLLTPEEAAARLQLSTRTLARWRLEGGGPRFLKIGSAVRYRASTVDDWASGREVSCTAEDPL